jgi:hypothetical protein
MVVQAGAGEAATLRMTPFAQRVRRGMSLETEAATTFSRVRAKPFLTGQHDNC